MLRFRYKFCDGMKMESDIINEHTFKIEKSMQSLSFFLEKWKNDGTIQVDLPNGKQVTKRYSDLLSIEILID